MLEQKGTKVTFDYNGNLMMVQNPKLRTGKNVTYHVAAPEHDVLKLDELDGGDAEEMM